MTKDLGERVKIVATIGPASSSPAVLRELLRAGVDAVRINASHVEPDLVGDWVGLVREAGRATRRDVAVMLDLQGIKHRIGDLPEPLVLKQGDTVVLSPRRGEARIPVRLGALLAHMRAGLDIFLDDGFIHLRVLRVSRARGEVACRVRVGGPVPSRAGINVPGVPVATRIPTRRDRAHIAAGVASGVDIFALSFVRTPEDLWRTRKLTEGIPIIAKIERPEAVAAIDAIALASDGLLIARGDLAVEMRPEQLPVLQKTLVAAGRRARRSVIVATEMLASMVHNPRPTRAELTDVGNAVLDGADATLLSDETAMGHDPVRAVTYMGRILKTVEDALGTYDLELPHPRDESLSRPDWAVADAAVETAAKVEARALIAITASGRTARLLSAARPSVPLYSFSPDAAVRRRVALMWGVNARAVDPIRDPDALIAHVVDVLRAERRLRKGQRAVFVFGAPLWAEGTKTNTVRVAMA